MTDLPALGGLGTLALISAWTHGPASPLLPAAFEPVLLAYGRSYPPLLVALVGTAASIPAEAVNYIGYRWLLQSRRAARARQASAAVTRLFARQPFLACLLVAATPLPDWGARILGALASYPTGRYLMAFALGRLPLFWLLAAAGSAIHLRTPSIVALVIGSIAATYGGMALGRRRERQAPAAA